MLKHLICKLKVFLGSVGANSGFWRHFTWHYYLKDSHSKKREQTGTQKLFLMCCDNRACYECFVIVLRRGAQIFQKSRSFLKILGTWKVTWNKFHTEGPQILGATSKFSHHGNLVPGICAPLVLTFSFMLFIASKLWLIWSRFVWCVIRSMKEMFLFTSQQLNLFGAFKQ